jgi:flagellar motor switch protein FliM
MLQTGDVLPLNTDVDGKLEIFAGDILKFYGKPGVRNKKVSVKITDVVRGRKRNDDMLSQAEIDALLNGVDLDDGPSVPEYEAQLKRSSSF